MSALTSAVRVALVLLLYLGTYMGREGSLLSSWRESVTGILGGDQGCGDRPECTDEDTFLFNLFPRLPMKRREKITPTFKLYTRRNQVVFQLLRIDDYGSVMKSYFDFTVPTKIIIPGYMDNMILTVWMQDMKNMLLLQGDYNVILIDWTRGNIGLYNQVVTNCPIIGADIADMITFLQKSTGAQPDTFHIIGHSLGAHIAGFAGAKLHGLGRITGLDPAGPLFRNVPPTERLDPTDANFVDVIHSDSATSTLDGLGTIEPSGHMDFYPSGGKRQPGCLNTVLRSFSQKGLTDALSNIVACQHQRAHEFFRYSINPSECLMYGVECDSWESFLTGQCGDCGEDGRHCAEMGFPADRHHRVYDTESPYRKFFLKVAGDRPYCVFHYHVALDLVTSGYKTKYRTWVKVHLTVEGTKGYFSDYINIKITHRKFKGVQPFLTTSKIDIGDITGATLRMVYLYKGASKLKEIYVAHVRVTPLFFAHPERRRVLPTVLQNLSSLSLSLHKTVTFGPEGHYLESNAR